VSSLSRARGQTRYLIFQHPDGRAPARVKRLSLPADARRVTVDQPGLRRTSDGRRVYGGAVSYEQEPAGMPGTVYYLPQRPAERTMLIPLPPEAKAVRLVDRPPKSSTKTAA
jgi:hypothetical protein